jgi:2-amino-4-hydroxy-6-hydroxymethyldihydropteridine diphosphokinase
LRQTVARSYTPLWGAGLSHTAYIGIGTNLGDRLRNYKSALDKIAALPDTRIIGKSSMYESEPHGKARTWFLNGVVEITTDLEAAPLLKELQKIETALGRKREAASKASVSREMDLDILLFDHDTIDSRNLKVPHPEMGNRKFVLLPLAELAPAFLHPVSGTSISSLLATSPDKKKVMLYRPR